MERRKKEPHIGYSAYERDFMGWRSLYYLDERGDYSMKALSEGGVGYKIINDENGTKAAAMTEVMVMMTSAGPSAQPKIIELNRPFFYMILENDTMIPLFMGTVYSME